jgi:hypothetical protein
MVKKERFHQDMTIHSNRNILFEIIWIPHQRPKKLMDTKLSDIIKWRIKKTVLQQENFCFLTKCGLENISR